MSSQPPTTHTTPSQHHTQHKYSRIAALARPVRLPTRLALGKQDRARAEALWRAVSDLAAMLPSV